MYGDVQLIAMGITLVPKPDGARVRGPVGALQLTGEARVSVPH